MRNYCKMIVVVCLCLCCIGARAQTSHWQTDIYAYQYDMTAYVALAAGDEAVTDYSNYEVAAFCGDECRGVASVQTANGKSYLYLRIRSNQSSGETFTFKVYVKDIDREVDVENFSMDFAAQAVNGLPSNPVVLSFVPYIPGDADGDGVVDLTDAVAIYEFYMNGEYPNFAEIAADFDGDGTVDLTDAVLIYEYYMNQ